MGVGSVRQLEVMYWMTLLVTVSVLISIELVAGGNGVLLGQVVSRCVVVGCRGQEVVGHEVVGHSIVGHEREGGEGEGGWLHVTALLVVLGSWHDTPAI